LPIELARLNLFTLHSVSPVLGANLRAGLEDDPESRLAIGAWDDDGPAGAAVLELAAGDAADVVWLYVRAAKRGLEIGSRLMRALEPAATEHGRKRLRIVYPVREQEDVWNRMLQTLGWTLLPQRARRIRVSASAIAHAPWFERWRQSSSLEVVLWTELAVDERERLQAATEGLAPTLRPALLAAGCDRATSVVLRRDGEVLGWLFTHYIDPKALSYTALFVWPERRRTGLAFAMVSEATRRQIETYGPDSIGVVVATADNTAMMRVAERGLAPYVVHASPIRIAEKSLA
jgi:GNAT superfamily N-acetyltransferase